MKKVIIIFSVILLMVHFGCKVSDSAINNFRLLTVSGYSLQDSGLNGATSINLFFSIKNTGNMTGTVKSWNFKLMHNIVELLEINSNNYHEYKLETSSSSVIPPEDVLEFYVNTPLPFEQNAIENGKLPFDTYTPNEVVVEVNLEDGNGDEFIISKRGSFVFEKGVVDSDQYNLLGNWEFTRTVNGDTKPKQKLTFVGMRESGNFVLYNYNSGKAEGSGTFTVTGYKNITLYSSDGTKYWGEFTKINEISGTLLKGTSTGFWIGKKM